MSKEKSKDKHSRPCNGNNSVSLAGELQSKSPVSECGLGRAENRNHKKLHTSPMEEKAALAVFQ
jgi:hypothetical protein